MCLEHLDSVQKIEWDDFDKISEWNNHSLDEGSRLMEEVSNEGVSDKAKSTSQKDMVDVEDMFPFIFKPFGQRNRLFPFVGRNQNPGILKQRDTRRILRKARVPKTASQSSVNSSGDLQGIRRPMNTLKNLKKSKYRILFPDQNKNIPINEEWNWEAEDIEDRSNIKKEFSKQNESIKDSNECSSGGEGLSSHSNTQKEISDKSQTMFESSQPDTNNQMLFQGKLTKFNLSKTSKVNWYAILRGTELAIYRITEKPHLSSSKKRGDAVKLIMIIDLVLVHKVVELNWELNQLSKYAFEVILVDKQIDIETEDNYIKEQGGDISTMQGQHNQKFGGILFQ